MKEAAAAARALRQRAADFLKLATALSTLDGIVRRHSASRPLAKRTLSVAGRKAIAQAQKRRWAKLRAQKAGK